LTKKTTSLGLNESRIPISIFILKSQDKILRQISNCDHEHQFQYSFNGMSRFRLMINKQHFDYDLLPLLPL